MPKFTAPEVIGHLEYDNVTYERGEDGLFTINHPDHVASARIHGLKEVDPNNPQLPLDEVVGRVASSYEEELAAKNSRIAELEALLAGSGGAAELAPTETLGGPGATDTPADTGAASESTSPATGGTTETVGEERDLIGEALAKEPNFPSMSRDERVEWLDSIGVVIPKNTSGDRALEIIKETLEDYAKSDPSNTEEGK